MKLPNFLKKLGLEDLFSFWERVLVGYPPAWLGLGVVGPEGDQGSRGLQGIPCACLSKRNLW